MEENKETTGQTQIDPNEHDLFVMRQRVRPLGNRYELTLADGDGEPAGSPFCIVQQKVFRLKEDIRFCTDDSFENELMRIKAQHRFDPAARYDVVTPAGETIGQFQKEFGSSLFRSTFRISDDMGREVAVATESSPVLALLRRLKLFLDAIPVLGEVADFLPIPYHFVFERNGEVLGTHRRQLWKVRDTYTIDVTGDPGHTLDRRLVLALGVGMDAFQSR